jgi:hypothetical protein
VSLPARDWPACGCPSLPIQPGRVQPGGWARPAPWRRGGGGRGLRWERSWRGLFRVGRRPVGSVHPCLSRGHGAAGKSYWTNRGFPAGRRPPLRYSESSWSGRLPEALAPRRVEPARVATTAHSPRRWLTRERALCGRTATARATKESQTRQQGHSATPNQ